MKTRKNTPENSGKKWNLWKKNGPFFNLVEESEKNLQTNSEKKTENTPENSKIYSPKKRVYGGNYGHMSINIFYDKKC